MGIFLEIYLACIFMRFIKHAKSRVWSILLQKNFERPELCCFLNFAEWNLDRRIQIVHQDFKEDEEEGKSAPEKRKKNFGKTIFQRLIDYSFLQIVYIKSRHALILSHFQSPGTESSRLINVSEIFGLFFLHGRVNFPRNSSGKQSLQVGCKNEKYSTQYFGAYFEKEKELSIFIFATFTQLYMYECAYLIFYPPIPREQFFYRWLCSKRNVCKKQNTFR